MLQQIWAVARNTFVESIRQPIYVVLLLGTILLMALNPALCAFTLDMEGDDKMLLDLGLSTLFVAGLLLAAFSAAGVFSREIANQTVLTVISKPIGRSAFVLGKYLGVLGALAVAWLVWAIAFLLSVRHEVLSNAAQELDGPVLLFGFGALLLAVGFAAWGNYFYRWVFASALTSALLPLILAAYLLVLLVGKHWEFQSLATNWNGQLWIAILMIFLALGLICAVAIAASIRLGQIMTLLICAGVFLIGLSSDYLFGQAAQHGSLLAGFFYRVVPNLGYLWQADALSQGRTIPLDHLASVAAYTGLYILGVLCLAVGLFQTREVG
ncbi:MAG: ABC transporter permease [Planctomycetes bacterium]|nr:ABC transporter permease [Planctomycetota bacterium]